MSYLAGYGMPSQPRRIFNVETGHRSWLGEHLTPPAGWKWVLAFDRHLAAKAQWQNEPYRSSRLGWNHSAAAKAKMSKSMLKYHKTKREEAAHGIKE